MTHKRKSYDARIGCWNCDIIYMIQIKRGTNTPEFLMKTEPKCKKCGCDTLKMLSEYKAEKKIMKDLLLHARVEHMGEDNEEAPVHHDHIQ